MTGFRIALYHPRAKSGDGGITRSVRALSSALRDEGYEVSVLFDDRDSPAADKHWRGIRHRRLGAFLVPTSLPHAIADVDVLVLHSAWVLHNVVAARVARRLGVPYVLAPRGAYDPMIVRRKRIRKRAWWELFEKKMVAGATAVHVFFDSEFNHIRSLGFGGPLLVAPNGVQVPEGIQWDGGSSGRLLFLGRFDPEHKGLDALVEAIGLLPEHSRPDVLLAGPDWKGGKARTADQINRLSLQKWITVGPAAYGSDKWELLTTSRGLLYPSRWEAFGNSVAEAAALGVPVLTGMYPLGRYLSEREAAIAVSVDPESLAEGIRHLELPSAAKAGRNAAAVIADFSWPRVSQTWGERLRELVVAENPGGDAKTGPIDDL